MKWHLIDSGYLPADEIMAKDVYLLQQLESDQQPKLHFYNWLGNSLTYGYFAKPENFLNLSAIEYYGIKMARRPTGGGIIFHQTDLAFSVLIPASHPEFSINALDNYCFINQKVSQAISHFSHQQVNAGLWIPKCSSGECSSQFCMSKPTQYDLMVEGKKVGGAAQRKTKWGFLHQGSLSLTLPCWELLEKVIRDKQILGDMQKHTYPLLKNEISDKKIAQAKHELKEALHLFMRG